MPGKSPQRPAGKKAGKSLKEKREAKRDKQKAKRSLNPLIDRRSSPHRRERVRRCWPHPRTRSCSIGERLERPGLPDGVARTGQQRARELTIASTASTTVAGVLVRGR